MRVLINTLVFIGMVVAFVWATLWFLGSRERSYAAQITPPANVATYRDFQKWMGPARTARLKLFLVRDSSDEPHVIAYAPVMNADWTVEAVHAAGPGYVFNADGRLIDWWPDTDKLTRRQKSWRELHHFDLTRDVATDHGLDWAIRPGAIADP